MKKITLILLSLLMAAGSYAQSVGINDDNSAPNASAMLDVKSASKGFLAPRIALTGSTDASTISSPVDGLLIYNTSTVSDVTPGYYYYNGSAWVQIGLASSASQWTTTGSDIYYNTGNVGIGTSSPGAKLEVNGTIKASQFKVDETGYFQTQVIDGSTTDVVIGCDPNDFFFYERENNFYQFNIGGNAKLRIQENGRVGIGTMAPDAPLHVNGAVGMYSVGATYFYGGSGLITATTDFNVSIHASHGILTNGTFIATSDKRVKENITELQNSLDLIGKLRPVSYNKIDKVEQGSRLNYGFIAQEVEEVIPVAVNTGKGEVPILQPFEKVGFEDGVTYTILVKNGDDIKEQTYTKGDARPEGEIIVKSKTVDDFKSLTYDMIFTVAVDAIQEQQAEIETLQQQVEKLQTQNAVLTQKTEAIDHLKAEVENLKKAMGLNIELTENK
ncbi:MAG: tail fiber domain-containing protein [Bacteroidetes bacterium]|nr:tail fiber domain-containing protein [Bacteroidota bacterium]